MRLFADRKSLILIAILLIACFLTVGCGNKTKVSETPHKSEKEHETFKQEATIDPVQEDREQTGSVNTTESVLKAEDAKTSPVKSSVTSKNQEDIKSQGQKQEKPDDTVSVPSVTVTIVGPKDLGVILEPTAVEIEEGETVLDVLKKAARQNNIIVAVRGKESTAYVEGIDNIFEFDYGVKSGWIYRVNGSIYSKSAGAYTVKAGDVIEWLYTLDLGRDLDDVAGFGGAGDE